MTIDRMGLHISDHRLMEVTLPPAIKAIEARQDAGDKQARVYVAYWSDGDRTFFAVPSAEHARTFASEYGIRYRNGDRPLRVVWAR